MTGAGRAFGATKPNTGLHRALVRTTWIALKVTTRPRRSGEAHGTLGADLEGPLGAGRAARRFKSPHLRAPRQFHEQQPSRVGVGVRQEQGQQRRRHGDFKAARAWLTNSAAFRYQPARRRRRCVAGDRAGSVGTMLTVPVESVNQDQAVSAAVCNPSPRLGNLSALQSAAK